MHVGPIAATPAAAIAIARTSPNISASISRRLACQWTGNQPFGPPRQHGSLLAPLLIPTASIRACTVTSGPAGNYWTPPLQHIAPCRSSQTSAICTAGSWKRAAMLERSDTDDSCLVKPDADCPMRDVSSRFVKVRHQQSCKIIIGFPTAGIDRDSPLEARIRSPTHADSANAQQSYRPPTATQLPPDWFGWQAALILLTS